jgi:uncharacterized protein HemX
MGRLVVTLAAVMIALAVGFYAGYVWWPREHMPAVPAAATQTELESLQQQKRDLEQRLEQVTKEQERLAEENEILHKQRTTDQLLGGPGGALPELPPK